MASFSFCAVHYYLTAVQIRDFLAGLEFVREDDDELIKHEDKPARTYIQGREPSEGGLWPRPGLFFEDPDDPYYNWDISDTASRDDMLEAVAQGKKWVLEEKDKVPAALRAATPKDRDPDPESSSDADEADQDIKLATTRSTSDAGQGRGMGRGKGKGIPHIPAPGGYNVAEEVTAALRAATPEDRDQGSESSSDADEADQDIKLDTARSTSDTGQGRGTGRGKGKGIPPAPAPGEYNVAEESVKFGKCELSNRFGCK